MWGPAEAEAAAPHQYQRELPQISDTAVSMNKVIYVDDFDDPDWQERFDRPMPYVLSELAIPIPVKGLVTYVVSFYRPYADAFTYDEIALFKGSAAHINTVFWPRRTKPSI